MRTPRLQAGLVRLSTPIPSFATAASELAFWTQVEVDRTTARRITEAAGATVVALETAAAAHILQTQPLPPPGPAQLALSVDGALVPLRHGQWAEARTLARGEVTPSVDADGQPSVQTTARSYFSRLTDRATFAELAIVELHRRGVETVGRWGAVVDGTEWCQTFLDLHTPHARRSLDFPHAAGYVEAIGQTVGPDGPLLTLAERRQPARSQAAGPGRCAGRPPGTRRCRARARCDPHPTGVLGQTGGADGLSDLPGGGVADWQWQRRKCQ